MSAFDARAEYLMNEELDRPLKRPASLATLDALVMSLQEEQGELFPPGTPLGPQRELPL